MNLHDKLGLTCQAPYKSLRFEHSGKVLASCFNRGYVLGEFPENSIEDIWFGEKIKALRAALCNNDFSLGCQTCGRNIGQGNRGASGSSQYDYLGEWENENGYPVMFDFEIGSTCNFECIMCSGEYSTSIRKNREKKAPYRAPFEDNIDLFVEQLIPFFPFLKEMRFLGGEPFLMKSLYNIWDESLKVNPQILLSVLTNGSILNGRIKDILDKGNFTVALSIDSINKKTYESIRVNGIFEEVMANAKYFHKLNIERGHTMNYNLCVMRQNWAEIPEYFEYCNDNGIQVVLHTVEFPLHCSIWNLPSIKLQEILDLYERTLFNSSTDANYLRNTNTFKSLTYQVRKWLDAAKEKERKPIIGDYKGLEDELRGNILGYQFNANDKDADFYFNFVMSVCDRFSEEEKIAILNSINQLRIDLVINEINVSTEERIYERFKLITAQPKDV